MMQPAAHKSTLWFHEALSGFLLFYAEKAKVKESIDF